MFGKTYPNCVKKEHLKVTTEQPDEFWTTFVFIVVDLQMKI